MLSYSSSNSVHEGAQRDIRTDIVTSMSEELHTSKPNEILLPTTEEIERIENERHETWMAEHPINDTAQDSPEICAERITVCEALLSRFEQKYDLEALRIITQFSSKEERENSIRQPALKALTPMFQLIRHLRKQEAVEREALKVLQARYTIISNAVGNVTGDPNGKIFDIVVHNRAIWPN